MNENTIGKSIKKIRKEKGLTQKELGKLCNMSEAQIGQYENGIRTPKFETLQKIAKALEVSYNLLIQPYNDSTFVYDKLDKTIMLKHTFIQSVEERGIEAQCRQLMEECAELVVATNKCLRYPLDKDRYANLVEEIADVEIMLYQLKVMFNVSNDEVFEVKIQKAKREQERLKEL